MEADRSTEWSNSHNEYHHAWYRSFDDLDRIESTRFIINSIDVHGSWSGLLAPTYTAETETWMDRILHSYLIIIYHHAYPSIPAALIITNYVPKSNLILSSHPLAILIRIESDNTTTITADTFLSSTARVREFFLADTTNFRPVFTLMTICHAYLQK